MINLANLITGFRVSCSLALLFFPTFSRDFYALYLMAGFSDMIDGAIARKLKTDSELGSRLDTIADSVMSLVCMIKIFPELSLPTWLVFWFVVIASIRVFNIILGSWLELGFVIHHTVLNKITGFLLFLLPLSLEVIDIRFSGAAICAIATLVAIEESSLIITGYLKS